MNEEELLAELVRQALPRYEKLQRQRAAKDKLSDDEWWERTVNTMPGLNPDLFQQMVEQKEQMLQVRHRMMNADPQEMAQQWATEILPFVVEARSAEKAPGRLTKKQVDKALQLRSQATIRRVADRTTKALETDLSPAAIQAAVSLRAMAQSELDDPLVASDPQLDEAALAERTGKHLASIQKMTDLFRRQFPKE